MTLNYSITYAENSIRPIHNLVINGESIITTRQKEVLNFARPRIQLKSDWKLLNESIRLGQHISISGGQ